MLEEKVLEKIKEYFLNDKNVAAVYLFGSTVKGRDRTNSDIDLAVLFYPYLDKEERFSAKLGMAVELAEMAGTQGYKIQFDILDLNSANLFFIHQLMKNKQLIIDKDPHYGWNLKLLPENFLICKFFDLYHKQSSKRLEGEAVIW